MAEPISILVVDDEEHIRAVVREVLQIQGFRCCEAASGLAGLDVLERTACDVILLDHMLPDLDGIEVARLIRQNLLHSRIPIVMLTGDARPELELAALEAGVDIFWSKPFNAAMLLGRLKAILRLSARLSDLNPTTSLPGARALEREMERRLGGPPFSVCHLDLDHFKAYADTYGYEAANEAIRATGNLAVRIVAEHGEADDVVTHIGGDDFLVVTSARDPRALCQRYIEAFDGQAAALFPEEDRRRGYYVGKDRDGTTRRFPLLTISIAVVSTGGHRHRSVTGIGRDLASTKSLAKARAGSSIATSDEG